MTEFEIKVYSVTATIPRGQTLSYKELAEKIGKPKAFRAVANALAKNKDPKVPCHRVIRSDGGLGGYSMGGKTKKKQLLQQESIES